MWSAWRLRHALSFDTGTTSALSTSPCISLRINDHNVAGGMKVDLTLIPMRGPVRDSLRRCTGHGRTQCSIDRSTPRTMRSHLSVRTSKPASHAPRSRTCFTVRAKSCHERLSAVLLHQSRKQERNVELGRAYAGVGGSDAEAASERRKHGAAACGTQQFGPWN